MICPKCKSKTRVLNWSRESKEDKSKPITRYRKCTGCGYRFKTKEVIMND